MVIDTSAMVAILLSEPTAYRLVEAVAAATRRLIGAPSLVETSAVMLGRKGPQGDIALSALLRSLDIEVAGMTEGAAGLARAAYARFGKGVGDPAVLNFGDCLACGIAMDLDEPLLFVGDDFARTDVRSAL